jgi:AMP phosphorylase
MFKLKAKIIDVETGGMAVASIHDDFAKANDIHKMERILVELGGKHAVAVVDTSERMIGPGEIGVFEDLWRKLGIKEGDVLDITPVGKPESTKFIRKKMDREELFDNEIRQIIQDVVDEKLTDVELVAFVAASYMAGLTLEETASLTRSIVDTGGRLNLKKKPILDKHSIGGVPGNRITMIIVPIIASLGLMIPKTSSRAITSPAGTADTMEVLADVSFSIDELTEIVKKTNGCIVWGGAINLAAADDKLIKVRQPLSLDPEGMMLASIMAKKLAVGATHIIFDLPIGEEAKLQSLGEARHLEREFLKLGELFKLNVSTVITDGNEPIGRGIGPVLEAKDVLWVLKNDKCAPLDLRDKSTMLAGKLLELCGKAKEGTGQALAQRQVTNGAALKKMLEIIEAQGGDPSVTPDKLQSAKYTLDYEAERAGRINRLSNGALSKIARAAGAPADQGAGILMHKRYGESVKEGEKIFTIYSESERNIDRIVQMIHELNPIAIK